MSQTYVANEGDAWQVTVDAVQRFYERVLTSAPRPRARPFARRDSSTPAEASAPPLVERAPWSTSSAGRAARSADGRAPRRARPRPESSEVRAAALHRSRAALVLPVASQPDRARLRQARQGDAARAGRRRSPREVQERRARFAPALRPHSRRASSGV